MTAVPAVPTLAVGQVLTAAQMNAFRDAVQFANGQVVAGPYSSRPLCQVRATNGTSVTTSVVTPIAMDTEDSDVDSMHSTSTNNSRLTANTPGYYSLDGGVAFPGQSTGYRAVLFRVNGLGGAQAGYYAQVNMAALAGGISTIATTSALIWLNAGDYVELCGYQNSGVSLTTDCTNVRYNYFQAAYTHA